MSLRSLPRTPDERGSATARIGGWLLALTLVLPSLIGWLHVPMDARAGVPTARSEHAQGQARSPDAMARLLADLAVLCTPYGLKLTGQKNAPAKPSSKIGHDNCVLCGLAGGAALGVLPSATALPPSEASDNAPAPNWDARVSHSTIGERPPGRGPPN